MPSIDVGLTTTGIISHYRLGGDPIITAGGIPLTESYYIKTEAGEFILAEDGSRIKYDFVTQCLGY